MVTNKITGTSAIIPVILLKTRSQPDDAYEEYFSSKQETAPQTDLSSSFVPHFVPVLEHQQNKQTLDHLGGLLRDGKLKEEYGGMIFTSQRAVEGWAGTVAKVERETTEKTKQMMNSGMTSALSGKLIFDAIVSSDVKENQTHSSASSGSKRITSDTPTDPFADLLPSLPFPLYTVGPATARTLQTLLSSSSSLTSLNASILGSHTGNGASLAKYILTDYNGTHSHTVYQYFEAPRLPFIPLLGMSSENYGRKRLERTDDRLRKKPLLFLVGEQRRDIIPRTLGDSTLKAEHRIAVDEVEVYSTIEADGFRDELEALNARLLAPDDAQVAVIVVVVFSPQGSETMLRSLGYVDEQGKATEKARARWQSSTTADDVSVSGQGHRMRYLIATIGPTTRDHLRTRHDIEPDVCALKPSPEGVGDAIRKFLAAKNLL